MNPPQPDPQAAAATGTGFDVALSDEQRWVAVDEQWLRRLAVAVLIGEGVHSAAISIALVDDRAIHALNRRFLQHDCPTDVISFSLNDKAGAGGPFISPGGADCVSSGRVAADRSQIDGEIVISGETAAICAGEQRGLPEHELALYLVHGLLHLCGYDDRSASQRELMRTREQKYLQKFGIVAHYGN